MVWIGVSVLGMLLSMLGVLLVVSPGVRKFCFGAVCGLAVAGVLLSLAQAPETGKETAVSWVARARKPGTPLAPTPQERPEAVSTPAEAAQAVQRFRAA